MNTASTAEAPPGAGAPTRAITKREDLERGVIVYTPFGAREPITLTANIVRRFFCDKADDLSAMTFMGFCRYSGLNPFMREVYLTVIDGKPVIQTAYTSFMKRAERHPQYHKFRAGIVLLKTKDDAIAFEGEDDIVPPPFVAIKGSLAPPGYELVGGWCKVWRKDRDEPIPAIVDLKEYMRYTREGAVQIMWQDGKGGKRATMIRKTAIGHGFRDAFSDELAGFHLEDEIQPDKPLPTNVIDSKAIVIDHDVPVVPEALSPLFERLGMNQANREMFLSGPNTGKSVDELKALLEEEIRKAGGTIEPPVEQQRDRGPDSASGNVPDAAAGGVVDLGPIAADEMQAREAAGQARLL